MTIGLGDYMNDGSTYGFVTRSSRSNDVFSAGFTSGYRLKENKHSSLYNENELTFGAGRRNGDNYFGQTQAASSLHYTTSTSRNGGLFLDANVGADIGVNHTYEQDVKYSIEFGPHIGVVKNPVNNDYQLGGKVGYYLENQSSERRNHFTTADVAVSGGLAVGVSGYENHTYAFGNINKELTNKRNTSVAVGLGHAREIEIFDADCVLNARAGYRFNLNDNTTNNWNKRSGAFVEAGVSIIL